MIPIDDPAFGDFHFGLDPERGEEHDDDDMEDCSMGDNDASLRVALVINDGKAGCRYK